MNVFEARAVDSLELDDVMLVADPEVPGLYLSRFRQAMTTADGSVTTIKRLYWRRDDGNAWRIVSEGAG